VLKYSISFLLGVIACAIVATFAIYEIQDEFQMQAFEHGFGVWRYDDFLKTPGPPRFQWLDDFIKEEQKDLWKAGDMKHATPPPSRL
jgi:hypothetical protein